MVAKVWRHLPVRALAGSTLLLTLSACGSFDPVQQTRFEWLTTGDNEFGMMDAHWVAYDDQHSTTSACTNRAAGNHPPEQCSHLDKPHFDWSGGSCPPSADQLDAGRKIVPEEDGAICIHGELSAMQSCDPKKVPEQCFEASGVGDVSNMWGAGFGLAFSHDGKTAWNPRDHRVRGMAFDLSIAQDTKLAVGVLDPPSDLFLRVEIPTLLPGTTALPSDIFTTRPVMREDGSVIDTSGDPHGCDGAPPAAVNGDRTELASVLLPKPDAVSSVSSELHPYGSPFWQKPADRDWGPSPVRVGHNEFEWGDVYPPPQDDAYALDRNQLEILGVHFQVVHPKKGNSAPLAFMVCINHLAVLLDE